MTGIEISGVRVVRRAEDGVRARGDTCTRWSCKLACGCFRTVSRITLLRAENSGRGIQCLAKHEAQKAVCAALLRASKVVAA
jgi:hypothetical protein